MKLKDVNHFLWYMFVVSVVVAMVVLAIAMRSDDWPCEPSTVEIVPLTRGPEFPAPEVSFDGQIHVTLDKIGYTDCLWIFKAEGNDWLAIGGPGCPPEEVK